MSAADPEATRGNPWLEIPLADYEGHMTLPQVGQAPLLADLFERALREHRPASVAVLGCAGGNGFDRIDRSVTTRVVGVDLNPAYVEEVRARFAGRIPGLELIAGDVQTEAVSFPAVALVFAALLFEYVDAGIVLERCRGFLVPGGILCTVLQLPSEASPAVTPSPFTSLEALAPAMRLVSPEALRRSAEKTGFSEIAGEVERTAAGKRFQVQTFRRS